MVFQSKSVTDREITVHHDKKSELYKNLQSQLESLLEGEDNFVANMANAASLFYHEMNKQEYFDGAINWFGFYLLDLKKKSLEKDKDENKKQDKELVLGPFQGLVACTRIRFDRGVCGHCATTEQVVIVPNVHEFPGHIACDSASNSEICVPLFNKSGQLIGLIDVDSLVIDSFGEEDRMALTQVSSSITKASDLEHFQF